MNWEPCTSRQWSRLHHQLWKSGVHVYRDENKHNEVVVFAVMDVLLLKYEWEEGKPRRHFYNPDFKWNFNHKAPLDIILPVKRRNPVTKKAKRVTRDDLIAGEIYMAVKYEDFKKLKGLANEIRKRKAKL
jgi:hypothetical protein